MFGMSMDYGIYMPLNHGFNIVISIGIESLQQPSIKKLMKVMSDWRFLRRKARCFASMEYLLAGRPVVSTPSLGGRDFFFDNRYVEIVDPTPEAVLEGVNRLRKKRLDPAFIRAETLKKGKYDPKNIL